MVKYRALIDVSNGKIVSRVGNKEVVFRSLEAMRQSLDHDDTWYAIDATNIDLSEYI